MTRFRIRTGGVCAAALALVLTTAAASAPAATPTSPSASSLKKLGMKVTWPLKGRAPVVKPGAKLSVKVSRLRGKKGTPVRLSFARTDRSGKATSNLRTAVVRSGTFAFTVPKGAGARYSLSLKAGKVRYTGRFSTAAAPPQKPPVTPPAPIDPCRPAGTVPAPSASVSLGATTVVAGQSVPYSVTNTGTTCLSANAHYGWERFDGTTWSFVAKPLGLPSPPAQSVPGATWAATVDAGTGVAFAPGHYRMTPNLTVDGAVPAQGLGASAEIDVTDPCVRPAGDSGTADATLHLSATAGSLFGASYTLENTGTTCLNVEVMGYRWEHLDGATWEPITPNVQYYGPAEFTVAPVTSQTYVVGSTGSDYAPSASTGSDWPAGHYRLTVTAYPRRGETIGDHTQPITRSAELDLHEGF